MEQELLNALKTQLEMSVQQTKFFLNAHGMGRGCVLPTEGKRIVTLPKKVQEKLVYKDIVVYTDDKEFYLTKDGFFLSGGHIDSEGTEATIINDITTTPEFINYNLMVANEDIERLFFHAQHPSFMIKYHEQAALGMKKATENNHY